MKKIIAAVCTAIAFTSPAAYAQTPAPAPAAAPLAAPDPAALAAVNELFEAMKYREMMTGMFAQMQQTMPPMMKQAAHAAIEGNAKLTPKQKKAAHDKADKDLPKAAEAMNTMFSDPKLMDELFAEIAPLYARHFTAAEIKQVAAFYKTPVGAKMITTMPQLMGESMQISQKVIMPRVAAMIDKMSKAE